MRSRLVVVLLLAVAVGGCSNVTSQEGGLDVEAVLGGLRDCEQLADVFMSLAVEATRQVDEIAIEGEAVDIGRAVQSVEIDRFFEGARQVGCSRENIEPLLLSRLGQIRPGTASGGAFLQTLTEAVATG